MKFKSGTRRRALEYEKDWVQKWKETSTFEKSVENRPKENSYVFYDGPPFITGVPHHGTLLSSIVKDAVPRYWTMKGKRVERVWGWDCHGLPAENFVEKQLSIIDRRQIVTSADQPAPLDKEGNELPTITLEQYITKARESMVANSETWESVVDRIGRWVDFKGAYRTMDKDFMESVWWAFKQLYDAGKIYEGEKVLMYDTKFATPVSKAEVTMDNDAYQTVTDPSVYVRFKLKQPIKSFLMGVDGIDDELTNHGFEFEKTESGNYKVIIPEDKTEEYERFVEERMKPGFWNEYINGNEIVFIFKDKVGQVSHYIYSEENEEQLLNLTEEYFGSRFESIEKMLAGNDWYTQTYLLAWTTTPWTLPANTALAVHKDVDYVELACSGENLIMAKSLVGKVMTDEKHQPLEYTVTREFKGAELVGKSYQPLFEAHGENAHKIWHADYVETEAGTGVVHIAPAYGEVDFDLAKEKNIPVVHVIDDNGYYVGGAYKGLEVWENNKMIAKDLKEKGIVWKIEYIQHEYPFNPRSGQRIMYRAIPSWFFDIQGSKPLMLEQNENINWFPEHIKHGRFAKNIEQAPDWNLSRDRFWATAMPVWKGDRGSIKVVGSYAELKELSGVVLEDYHRPWVDDITFEIDGEKFTRIDKVLDGWFESGSMPFAQLHYPFENQQKFEENYPADFIVEYIGQVRAWFYYVHAVNTALAEIGAFGNDSDRQQKNAFKNVITTGVLAGNDGRKMSKSLGNFTDPNELMDKFSADSLRFLLLSSPLLNGEDFNLQDKDVGDVARKLSMIWNMYDFFTMYAEVDGWEFDPTKPLTLNPGDVTNPLDKWVISRLHQLNQEVSTHMDEYNIPDAMSPILPFIDDASNWYVRRSRRRFWKSEDDGDKNDAYRTLHYVLLKLSVVLAPFTPFLAEELYHKMGGGNESVHLLDWPANYTVDEQVMNNMERVRFIVNQALSGRAKLGIKTRQPIESIEVKTAEPLDEVAVEIIKEEVNVKRVDIVNDSALVGYNMEIGVNGELTPELKREGLMREVIRFVQNARKQAGLNVDDRIMCHLETGDEELKHAIDEHIAIINAEILSVGDSVDGDVYNTTANIENSVLVISLKKA